jgi:phosphoribosylformylglycinamidine cyclo-ligase
MYLDGEYDLAGSIVGIVEKSQILAGAKVRQGDALIALPSNGMHTNGYSLARKLLFDVAGNSPASLADELLRVHRSYLKAIGVLIKGELVLGAAHITGGGITDNLPRVIPKGLAAAIDIGSWQVPPLFEDLRRIGSIPDADWRRTFNLGVGMIFIVRAGKTDAALRSLKRSGEKPWVIGEIVKQKRARVEYR